MTTKVYTSQMMTQDFMHTFALGWMVGWLAAKGFPDGAPETPEWKKAEAEGLAAMLTNGFHGAGNVKAYKEAKAGL
jgi:hypothetical protein